MKPQREEKTRPSVEFVDWGTVDYAEATDRQRELFETLVAEKNAAAGTTPNPESGRRAGWLVMCEHPPVYTIGRSGAAENLLVSEQALRERGATLHRTERGGDITYHGPGQIVGYPILDLERLGIGLRDYIAALEQAVIETVAAFGMEAGRIPGKTGVWVKDARGEKKRASEMRGSATECRPSPQAGEASREGAKICAIGVRASRGVVMHGFALNVATGLEWFDLINPCGFVGGAVTSMERETGRKIEMDAVKRVLREKLKENLRIEIQKTRETKFL